MKSETEILKNNQLSVTKSRINILSVLKRAEVPLSEKEIEELLEDSCDKTTIYRNLAALSEKGVFQRILSGDCVKYKLISHNNEISGKQDHVHFQCQVCQQLICMEELLVNDYKLPEGFSKSENQFLIIGTCKDCNHA